MIMNKKISLPTIWPVTCHTDYVGKNSTFVAIKGQKFDGIDYVPLALQKGAKTIVAEQIADIKPEIIDAIKAADAQLIFVANARRSLALLAANAWGNPAQKLKIIAITGTKGKTTTSWLLHHLLQSAGKKTALLSTVKNKIGDQEFATELTTAHPDYLHTFFHTCVKEKIEYVIMEVAAQAVSLHRVAGLAFDGAIFTNFAQTHGEFYDTMQEYYAAKRALFDQCKPGAPLVINADDEKGAEILQEYSDATSFALKKADAQITGRVEASDAKGIRGSYSINNLMLRASLRQGFGGQAGRSLLSLPKGQHERDEVDIIASIRQCKLENRDESKQSVRPEPVEGCKQTIECPALIGYFNLYNILAATSMAWRLGISHDAIAQGLQTFTGIPGRLEKYELPNDALCFIDYAHNPLSFQSVLSLLRSMTDHLIVVAGAGGDRDKNMRPIMGQLMAEYADQIFITTDNPRSENPADIIAAMYAGVPSDKKSITVCELDRQIAIQKAYSAARAHSIIALLGKGPDEYQIFGTVKTYFSEREIIKQL